MLRQHAAIARNKCTKHVCRITQTASNETRCHSTDFSISIPIILRT